MEKNAATSRSDSKFIALQTLGEKINNPKCDIEIPPSLEGGRQGRVVGKSYLSPVVLRADFALLCTKLSRNKARANFVGQLQSLTAKTNGLDGS